MSDSVSYASLSFLAFQAVLQVVIVSTLGFFAAKAGLLSTELQKQISALNVEIFTPCLVFSKLGSSLTMGAMADLGLVPIIFLFTTGVSWAGARIASRLFRLNEREANFVTAMSVFGNSNSLPVSLTVSLAYSMADHLQWDVIPDDSADNIASRGILYLVLFQQLGQILRWSWGYNTLLSKPTPEEIERIASSRSLARCSAAIQSERNTVATSGSSNFLTVPTERAPLTITVPHTNYESFAINPLWRPVSISGRYVMSFMNRPLWSMLFAIVVAAIPQLQHQLFSPPHFLYATAGSAVKQVGGVAVPLILVVLGGNLAPSAGPNRIADTDPSDEANHSKVVILSLICRMIIPATVLFPALAFLTHNFVISILDDPIFIVVLFLLTTSPPAIQLSQICQLNGIFEREMTAILFWGYVVLTLPFSVGSVALSMMVLNWAK
ncbi:hypothetical protein CANCADRAFT_27270 [Tortispora caseinolytica NRRL Y-17796]|uniref:Auxin efflux carrier n=1 Tax=Tortispora caseinolytica NRRL Y-17796 TaxID=767744 RepID=A0A1E4TCG2_9ASCO|nr:hypothetical protein CANCADRAFT_27270 [Tortispora caseinolytica NRRL Y-17796]